MEDAQPTQIRLPICASASHGLRSRVPPAITTTDNGFLALAVAVATASTSCSWIAGMALPTHIYGAFPNNR